MFAGNGGSVSAVMRQPVLGMFRRKVIIVMSMLVLLGVAAVGVTDAQTNPIRFGAVFVLSGDGAAYGQSQREGTELARDKINAAGGVGGRPIEVLFEDSA